MFGKMNRICVVEMGGTCELSMRAQQMFQVLYQTPGGQNLIQILGGGGEMSFTFPKQPCFMQPTIAMAIAVSFLILLRRKGCNKRKTVFYIYLHSLQLTCFLASSFTSLCGRCLLSAYCVCEGLRFFLRQNPRRGFLQVYQAFFKNF